ncbi:hypothetical protein ACFPK1_21110 [Actinomycetospora rhizophila]|uniref:Uncharacterized protein n=1 Tax=Actinomycetospora rhizophila TaxID=1416876 RepID=A0ABV9ZH92_9PSEU
MKTLALTLGGLAAAWMAAPTVAMATHGTVDDRTRAAWRAKPVRAPFAAVPAPRRAPVSERIPA